VDQLDNQVRDYWELKKRLPNASRAVISAAIKAAAIDRVAQSINQLEIRVTTRTPREF